MKFEEYLMRVNSVINDGVEDTGNVETQARQVHLALYGRPGQQHAPVQGEPCSGAWFCTFY